MSNIISCGHKLETFMELICFHISFLVGESELVDITQSILLYFINPCNVQPEDWMLMEVSDHNHT